MITFSYALLFLILNGLVLSRKVYVYFPDSFQVVPKAVVLPHLDVSSIEILHYSPKMRFLPIVRMKEAWKAFGILLIWIFQKSWGKG